MWWAWFGHDGSGLRVDRKLRYVTSCQWPVIVVNIILTIVIIVARVRLLSLWSQRLLLRLLQCTTIQSGCIRIVVLCCSFSQSLLRKTKYFSDSSCVAESGKQRSGSGRRLEIILNWIVIMAIVDVVVVVVKRNRFNVKVSFGWLQNNIVIVAIQRTGRGGSGGGRGDKRW